jgi:SAM-dependent methyltransferase
MKKQNDWDVERYEAGHEYVWKLGKGVLDWLEPKTGESILDLGCGSGQLTSEIGAMGVAVTGVDSAPSMVAQARINYPDLTFQLADARDLPFANQFDAVFSNAVLHWVRPPEQAVSAIAKALKPGGRFVCEFGGKGNVASIMSACAGLTPDWYYPSIGEYASILEACGFEVRQALLFDRPTLLDPGEGAMEDWLRMFVKALDSAALHEAVEKLRPTQYQNGQWTVDYRRIRVKAVKL